MRKKWFEITIFYSGGATFQFVTDEFTWERGSGGEGATWGAIRKNSPKPLKLGVDDIVAVWSRKL